MSIGAVLDLLRSDFPDVTISKIRFLEAEGLVTPERTASGYRRFTAYDCARLRFILTAQRDQYLPLKVIKAQLDALPDGELPQTGSAYAVPRLVPVGDGGADGGTTTADGVSRAASGMAPTQIRLTREDLLQRSGVDETLLGALIKNGVITPGKGGLFDEHSVVIAQCAKRSRNTASNPGTCARSAPRPTGSPISSRRSPDRWSRRARPVRVTAPTIWPARSRRWRSRFTRR